MVKPVRRSLVSRHPFPATIYRLSSLPQFITKSPWNRHIGSSRDALSDENIERPEQRQTKDSQRRIQVHFHWRIRGDGEGASGTQKIDRSLFCVFRREVRTFFFGGGGGGGGLVSLKFDFPPPPPPPGKKEEENPVDAPLIWEWGNAMLR